MSELLERVERAVTERRLFARGQKILAAVSGGTDSMVLLRILHLLAPEHHWRILVAHFNHRLRGRASGADERLVRRTAARLGLEYVAGGADVKQAATRSGLSLEMAARKLRHEFLAQTARRHRVAVLALAHHADDQVELFFLRLLRGTGGEGLAGMKWRSRSPADQSIFLVRPLLDCTKAELLAFARAGKVTYRDDASNASVDILRNRVRHQLLPLLRKQYQPGVDKLVLRLMELVGAESEVVGELARDFLGRPNAGTRARSRTVNRGRPGPGRLRAAGDFARLAVAVQRKVLQQGLVALGLLPEFELIERLRNEPGKEINVYGGFGVSSDAEGRVHCRESLRSEFDPSEITVQLSAAPGRVAFGGGWFGWRREALRQFRRPPKPSAARAGAVREFFDADKVGGEIVLRHWRPGDRFQPMGMKSAVKLQDLFVNAKIPAARRRQLVLATTQAGEIFWVDGLRIGERFKLTPQTRRKLIWRRRAG